MRPFRKIQTTGYTVWCTRSLIHTTPEMIRTVGTGLPAATPGRAKAANTQICVPAFDGFTDARRIPGAAPLYPNTPPERTGHSSGGSCGSSKANGNSAEKHWRYNPSARNLDSYSLQKESENVKLNFANFLILKSASRFYSNFKSNSTTVHRNTSSVGQINQEPSSKNSGWAIWKKTKTILNICLNNLFKGLPLLEKPLNFVSPFKN